MKLCFLVADISHTGGVERVTSNLASQFLLEQRGVEIDIVSQFKSSDKLWYSFEGCNIHYLNSSEFGIDKFVLSNGKPILYSIAHTDCYEDIYKKIIDNISDTDCLVISYPYADKMKKQWWKNVINDVRTGVTFDLYELGIVFFNKKRIKENRIVNFL